MSIASLPLPCGTNTGGLRHLQIIAVSDIDYIPTAINSVIETSIALRSGAQMAIIEFPPGVAEFTEPEKDSDAGVTMLPKLKLSIIKDAPEIGNWANVNLEAEVIAIYQDGNGIARIIGDLERPLTLRTSFATGRRGTDSNDYDITLDGISDHKAYYYQMFERKTAGNRKIYSAGYTFGYLRT